MLALAKLQRWVPFEQACIHFINSSEWGLRLSSTSSERLAFEFKDFYEPTLGFFERLRPLITDIICTGTLSEHSEFGSVLKGFPQLYGLDISRTPAFSLAFQEIPKALQLLNVSECAWVSKDTIKRIYNLIPNLKQLLLQSNVHLNYIFWGELVKFKSLNKLNISSCTQLQDADLSLILKGLHSLTELSLNNCKKITERGFSELAKSLPRLVRLSVSRCEISDTALIDILMRCRYLTGLDISACDLLTEKSILALVKQAASLQELNISRCHVSVETIEKIKKTFPQLVLKV